MTADEVKRVKRRHRYLEDAEHRERIKASARRYYETHREKMKEYMRKYAMEYRRKLRERTKNDGDLCDTEGKAQA